MRKNVAYCPTLTLAGHSDWRLLSRIELVSIVDVGLSNPSINGTYFPATPASYFWSSSGVMGGRSVAWYVNFDSGYSNYYGSVDLGLDGGVVFSAPVHVRCVR